MRGDWLFVNFIKCLGEFLVASNTIFSQSHKQATFHTIRTELCGDRYQRSPLKAYEYPRTELR